MIADRPDPLGSYPELTLNIKGHRMYRRQEAHQPHGSRLTCVRQKKLPRFSQESGAFFSSGKIPLQIPECRVYRMTGKTRAGHSLYQHHRAMDGLAAMVLPDNVAHAYRKEFFVNAQDGSQLNLLQ